MQCKLKPPKQSRFSTPETLPEQICITELKGFSKNTDMKTKNDFTTEELMKIKSINYWYYEQIINNSVDLYMDYGIIKDKNDNHSIVGITGEKLQSVISDLKSSKFAYARYMDYGITIYHYDQSSPTGVRSVNGIENSFMWLVDAIAKVGTLSPTEGLQTAH